MAEGGREENGESVARGPGEEISGRGNVLEVSCGGRKRIEGQRTGAVRDDGGF